MATTGTVNSTLMVIKVGSATISCLTDASLSMTQEMRDTTCKDSNSWNNALPAKRTWELSGSLFFAYDATYGADDLFDVYAGGQSSALTVKWGTTVTGDKTYGGSAYLTSLEFAASGTDENTTVNFTMTGVGALASATNS